MHILHPPPDRLPPQQYHDYQHRPPHPSHPQTRGKKKQARKPDLLVVRLLQDVTSYGRRGAIIPAPVGLMRNTWYPHRLAEYVTPAEVKTLSPNAVGARDHGFDVKVEKKKLLLESLPEAKMAEEEAELDEVELPPEQEGARRGVEEPERISVCQFHASSLSDLVADEFEQS